MGVIKRGILGGFSGKVANVVGSSWKGIAYMKSLPLSVANPNTAAQITQRTKFASVVAAGSILLVSIVKPLWDRFAQQMSGFNEFVQINIDVFNGTGLDDPEEFVIGKGSLTPADVDITIFTQGTPAVGGSWTDNSGTGTALATDEAYAVCYNQTQNIYGVQPVLAVRSAEAALVQMPANLVTADEIFLYLSFRRADGTLVSNTTFDTETVL